MTFDLATYRSERSKGTPAEQALRIAKTEAKTEAKPVQWPIDSEDQTFDVGPFKVRVKLEQDYHPDWELIFGGAMERAGRYAGDGYPYDDGQFFNDGRTFIVGTGREDYIFTPDESLASVMRYCHKAGMSRHDARLRALEQFKAQGEYARKVVRNDIAFVGIVVTVTLEGEKLGRASCWGFEFEDWHTSGPYISEAAQDLIAEALDQARAALPDAIKDHETAIAALRAAQE